MPRHAKEALLNEILSLGEITNQQVADTQQPVRLARDEPLKLASHTITAQQSPHTLQRRSVAHTPINPPRPAKG
jgi:hypothetical protein